MQDKTPTIIPADNFAMIPPVTECVLGKFSREEIIAARKRVLGRSLGENSPQQRENSEDGEE